MCRRGSVRYAVLQVQRVAAVHVFVHGIADVTGPESLHCTVSSVSPDIPTESAAREHFAQPVDVCASRQSRRQLRNAQRIRARSRRPA